MSDSSMTYTPSHYFVQNEVTPIRISLHVDLQKDGIQKKKKSKWWPDLSLSNAIAHSLLVMRNYSQVSHAECGSNETFCCSGKAFFAR